MILDFYRHLAHLLSTETVVLATIISIKGSVPREVGAKMMVWGNGCTFGTIGGGAGEAKVIQQARTVLATGDKQLVEIDLSGSPQRDTQGVCGGTMQVLVEPWIGDGAIALAHQILTHLEAGQTVTLVTPLEGSQFPYLTATLTRSAFVFTETLQPPPLLLIVGAGHVGEQVAKVAQMIGFQVAVQDDRLEWANRDRYPQASQIFNESIIETLAQLAKHSHLFATLVTRGYQYDLDALQVLLNRELPCKYIGMIGSKKRVKQVYQALEPDIPKQKLASIYAPIGLDIGAQTPEEIAVSIAAELILVRRGGSGKPLAGN
ncbi:XdhC family protein [Phormidium sp. CLA17]|uniref:XdhC family protein n=1 Tax=Leptolyngbya sp. Cla-17 TaxID=2803751 RepID=UPI0014924A50|nr:XdhC/CoxI family protein [Leptolyngbya sp. Cla-17]MBM0741862.1 XdhC family protein [Leptolyngbya sp. Cla-17]